MLTQAYLAVSFYRTGSFPVLVFFCVLYTVDPSLYQAV